LAVLQLNYGYYWPFELLRTLQPHAGNFIAFSMSFRVDFTNSFSQISLQRVTNRRQPSNTRNPFDIALYLGYRACASGWYLLEPRNVNASLLLYLLLIKLLTTSLTRTERKEYIPTPNKYIIINPWYATADTIAKTKRPPQSRTFHVSRSKTKRIE